MDRNQGVGSQISLPVISVSDVECAISDATPESIGEHYSSVLNSGRLITE